MIYVISDLHGCYEEYIMMLKLINFNADDTLYVIGDVCDRGTSPMRILLHMLKHDNIIPIWGNHDLRAYNALSKIGMYSKEVLKDNDYVITHYLMDHNEYFDFLYWLSDGGKVTLEDYDKLSISDKRKVLDYLQEFKYYEDIIVNNKEYILVHGGLAPFEENKKLDSYRLEDIIWERTDINKTYFKDKYIVFGHTPTKHYDKAMAGKIIIKNNNIAIDCGCVFGYGLGCICLDNMREYYVKTCHKYMK